MNVSLDNVYNVLQVDWEEYYSHYLVDLLGLDQVREEIGLKRSKLSGPMLKQNNAMTLSRAQSILSGAK